MTCTKMHYMYKRTPNRLIANTFQQVLKTERRLKKFVLFSYVLALFKAVVWALIFLIKLRFPPEIFISIVLKD